MADEPTTGDIIGICFNPRIGEAKTFSRAYTAEEREAHESREILMLSAEEIQPGDKVQGYCPFIMAEVPGYPPKSYPGGWLVSRKRAMEP